MIQVQRPAAPTVLTTGEAQWVKDLRGAKRAKNDNLFAKIQGRYAHKTVRDSLEAMFNGKCAYCESDIGIVSATHIEHFRPKGRYLSLTFRWENLLLSCPICNDRGHKGTKFPSVMQGGLLIDPSAEDPSIHLEFVYDSVADLAIVKPLTLRGKTAVDIFGLNARVRLVRARTRLVRQLLALKAYEHLDARVAAVLADARADPAPYLGWVRRLI